MSGKWDRPDVPHRDWYCVNIYDHNKPDWICEMCDYQPVRYVHVMEHQNYGTLKVGCICAGRMEQDIERARQREAQFTGTIKRRSKWLGRRWQTSASGNEYINTDGFNIVVFPRGGSWSGRIEYRDTGKTIFSQKRYQTSQQAKLAAFDAIVGLKKQMK